MTMHANRKRQAPGVVACGPAQDRIDAGGQVTTVPLQFRRRGHRTLLVSPQARATVSPAADMPMIKALGRAYYWQRLLDEGRYANVRELSVDLKVEPGWAAELLRMTLLAPDIVEAIVAGRQPRHLTLQTLRGRNDILPRDWDAQRRWLGCEPLAAAPQSK